MKVIDLPRKQDNEDAVDYDRVPDALINAVAALREADPGLDNYKPSRPFDRKFEQLHNCLVEYGPPDRVIFPNERAWFLFQIKWSSK